MYKRNVIKIQDIYKRFVLIAETLIIQNYVNQTMIHETLPCRFGY